MFFLSRLSWRRTDFASARPVPALSLLALTVAGVLLACGGRSSLEAFDAPGSGGNGAQGGGGSGQGGGGGIIAPPACVYQPAGDPVVAIALPDRHVNGSALVTTNDDPAQGPLEIAFQYIASGGSSILHDENPISRVVVGSEWPDIQVDPPVSAGVNSHSYGVLARSQSGNRMGLSWFTDLSDSGRVAFRTIDTATNTLGPIADIELGAQSPVGLNGGASINTNATEYVGEGYGIAWRRNLMPGASNTIAMAILNDEGAMMAGPHDITPPLQSPTSSGIVWSGSNYLMAAIYTAANCAPNEPLCQPKSLTVMRYRKASGDEQDDSGIDAVAFIPQLPAGTQSGRLQLIHNAGRTWLAWAEAISDNDQDIVVFRLVELSPDGTPIGMPQQVGAAPGVLIQLTAHASDQGITFSWFEDDPETSDPQQIGSHELHVLTLDHEGEQLGDPIVIPITQMSGGLSSIATLGGTPRSLILGWSGYRVGGGLDVGYLARLNCSDLERMP